MPKHKNITYHQFTFYPMFLIHIQHEDEDRMHFGLSLLEV